MSRAAASTSSGVIFSLASMWSGLVAINRWMRGSAATRTASHAASISLVFARARDATVQSLTACEIARTDSKSAGEEIANPASITSTFIFSRHLATSIFSRTFMEHPGDCSPSRSVVSKIMT